MPLSKETKPNQTKPKTWKKDWGKLKSEEESRPFSTVFFLTLWQDLSICLSSLFISILPSGSPEWQNSLDDKFFSSN